MAANTKVVIELDVASFSKIFGLASFAICLTLMLIRIVISPVAPMDIAFGGMIWLLLFCVILGLCSGAIFALVFNKVSETIGGIKITMEDDEDVEVCDENFEKEI